jgi:alpha-glucosidase (family GH31 glycosyl hydrolase)
MMEEFTALSGGRRPFISDCAGGVGALRHPSLRLCDRSGHTPSYREMMSGFMSGVPYIFIDQWGTPAAGIYPGFPGDPNENCSSRETVPHPFFFPSINGQSWSSKYCLGYPWEQGAEWANAFRYYDKLRYALTPYYYSEAASCTRETGLPMTRPLALEFQNDPKTYALEAHTFMFGGSMLVAIAYEWMKGEREVYLPAGADWIDYWTGDAFTGGQSVKLKIPATGAEHLCGLFARAGSIIPMQAETPWIGEEGALPAPPKPLDLILDIYPKGDSSYSLYEDDGSTMGYTKGKFCQTPVKCKGLAETVIVTVGKRTGDYKPAARSCLLKINGTFKPLEVAWRGEAMKQCGSFAELQKTTSGWFYGNGGPLFTGPEGFNLNSRADTVWVKIPDTGEEGDVVVKKTE